MNKCYIGIDPAFRSSGFAVCIIDEDNTVGFKMFKSFLDFLDWIYEAPDPKTSYVCVENSNLQQVTFNMSGNKRQVARTSRNVGANMAASQYTYDACRRIWGANAFEVSPKEKGKKWTNTEYQHHIQANKHKVLKSTSNQDERDAYKLALIARKLSNKI